MESKHVIIIGAGGHCRPLIDILKATDTHLLGITDPNPDLHGQSIMGIPVIGNDSIVLRHSCDSVLLVNAIGAVDNKSHRQLVFRMFKEKGYRFARVIHPATIISPEVELAEGIQIMAGAIIQAQTVIGDNTLINTGARVDHECKVGNHVHIAPGVTISGRVGIGDKALIGAGATIIQGIHIGANSIIGAGAVVVRDVPSGVTVMGVPARVRY